MEYILGILLLAIIFKFVKTIAFDLHKSAS